MSRVADEHIFPSYARPTIRSTMKRAVLPVFPANFGRRRWRQIHRSTDRPFAPWWFTKCIACEEAHAPDEFPALQQDVTRCTHKNDTCRSCWSAWVLAQIGAVAADHVSCAQCSHILSDSEVRHLTSSEVYERYLATSLAAVLSADPDFHWCISASCESGQIHIGDGNLFTCSACDTEQCIACGCVFHHGLTCRAHKEEVKVKKERYEAHKDEEQSSEELVKEISKACPGCNRNIQKNDGCDHMTCSQCLYQFCWLCLAPYVPILQSGNEHHNKDCKWYAVGGEAGIGGWGDGDGINDGEREDHPIDDALVIVDGWIRLAIGPGRW